MESTPRLDRERDCFYEEQIQALKADRAEMYELKEAGFDHRVLITTISNMTEQSSDLNWQINRLIEAEREFIASQQTSVAELNAEIERVHAERSRFVAEFDAYINKRLRAATHRQELLAQQKDSGASSSLNDV